MKDALQAIAAQEMYEKTKQRLATTPLKTWEELSGQEREQCMRSVDLWLRGLGANEVSREWYKRSGQVPQALWGQLFSEGHADLFGFAALDVIDKLVDLAEQAVKESQAFANCFYYTRVLKSKLHL